MSAGRRVARSLAMFVAALAVAGCSSGYPGGSPRCGDGRLAATEVCDDGNAVDGDGCSAACVLEAQPPGCGDGVRDAGEACDDGNRANGDGCSFRCEAEPGRCGNGTVDPGETCDDGNAVDGDGCDHDCWAGARCDCGDGIAEPSCSEECDDGNAQSGDGCSGLCRLEDCGNGTLDPGEECDDLNLVDGDGCSASCLEERCGNGRVDAREGCDDGNQLQGDGCRPDCRRECLQDRHCDPARREICTRNPDGPGGACSPDGVPCVDAASCAVGDPERCPSAQACVCIGAGEEGEGVCWTRAHWLEECATDAECGAGPSYERPGRCVELPCVEGPLRLCVPVVVPGRLCPEGLTTHEDFPGVCVPPHGTCVWTGPCRDDGDCRDPLSPVCDQVRGVCVPGCRVDASTPEAVTCPPSKPACHALPERLDPLLLNECETAPAWGHGKCGVECGKDEDCAHRGNGLDGRPFVCREDLGVKRCRPAGCLADHECPVPDDGLHLGHCDLFTQTCVADRCRLFLDTRAGCGVEAPFVDCTSIARCVQVEGLPEGLGRCDYLPD